jgi:hypothetical protein
MSARGIRMKACRAVACAVLVAGLTVPAWAGDPQKPQTPPQTPKPATPKPQTAKPKPVPLTPAQLAKRAPGRPGSFEVMGGAAWLGAGSVGSTTANLTANGATTPYQYFTVSGDMAAAPGIDARLTYNLTRRFSVEGGVTYSAPSLRVTIGNDAEGASITSTPSEKVTQYFVDASLLVFLPGMTFSKGRGRMFVEGGAGYLRQLHEGNFNVDTGQVYNAGVGVKQFLKPRPRGFVKGFGWRADVRAYYKDGGYSFDGAATWTIGAAGAAIVAF